MPTAGLFGPVEDKLNQGGNSMNYAEKLIVSRDRLEEALTRIARLKVLVQAVEDNEEYSGITLMTTWMDELTSKAEEDILCTQRELCKCIQNMKYGESVA